MADAGIYWAVARNDQGVPDIVHNSIQPDTTQGIRKVREHAQGLFESSRQRVPFCVVKIEHRPIAETSVGNDPSRLVTSSEQEYWYAIDSGKHVLPPTPCRYCGLVWEHDVRCITEVGSSS